MIKVGVVLLLVGLLAYMWNYQVPAQAATPQNEMVQYINNLRADYGVAPLNESCILDLAAQGKAEDFNNYGYFDHTNPVTGWSGNEWKAWAGYPATVPYGENILWSGASVADAFASWVNSQPHFENMVSGQYTEVGVGITSGSPYWGVYVLEFGSNHMNTCSETPPNPPQATKTPISTPYTLTSLNVRSAPSQSATILGVLPAYVNVSLLNGVMSKDSHIWVKVSAQGLTGWVASEYLAGVVTTPYGEEPEAIPIPADIDIGEPPLLPASPVAVET